MIRVAALLAFIGTLTGFSASLILTRRYVATATAAFPQLPGNAAQLLQEAFARSMEQDSLMPLIANNSSLSSKLDYTPVEDELEALRAGATAHVTGPGAFAVKFTGDDPDAARDIAHSLLPVVCAKIAQIEKTDAAPKEIGSPRVDEAGPTTRMLSLMGLSAGLLAAAIVRSIHR